MDSRPVVTVCIATKDRATTLPRAVETVLSQTYRAIELIIVDDGSSDNTPDVVQKYERIDTRVRGIRHPKNRGLAAARNSAIFEGIGMYFTFVDDDDAWHSTFIEKCVDAAERESGTRCYCTGYRSMAALGDTRRYVPCFDGMLRDYILAGYTPPVASQFYIREQLVAIGGYNESVRSGVDHDLWLRLASAQTRLHSVPHVLAYPDTSLSGPVRMTTDFRKRSARIAESLRLWEPLIDSTFPRGFHSHFTRSYTYAMVRKELAALVSRRRIASAVRLLYGSPFPRRLARFILSRVFSRIRAVFVSHRDGGKPDCIPPSFPAWRAS